MSSEKLVSPCFYLDIHTSHKVYLIRKMKKGFFVGEMGVLLLLLFNGCECQNEGWIETATIRADKVMVFNGIPKENSWGNDLVYQATEGTEDIRAIGSPWLGGIPLVDIWSEREGVALFNIAGQHEMFMVQLIVEDNDAVTIQAKGGSNIIKFPHQGDYFEAMREFARQMNEQEVSVQPAPDWSFDPIWETYGFEESWSPSTVMDMLPLLKELGIKTITLDSGWYGEGTDDWVAYAGDFPINPDVIGTEQNLIDLINELHSKSFKVRLWWTPGVAEKDTQLYNDHPDWFYSKVTPSWGNSDDTGDWYLNPSLEEVRTWNRDIVQRFIGYGADGFKQDDVYEISSDSIDIHREYSALFQDIFTMATSMKTDFVINTCNCGLAQNIFDFPGENQIITSDPVGPLQFRRRAKYLHALNINGAAILGDHIELAEGDVGGDEISESSWYERISDADFASTVALGMVLETKFRVDPGERYRKWFALYSQYKFYQMEWVNIPYFPWNPVETYLMKDGDDLYFSFFTPSPGSPDEAEGSYTGDVELSNLEAGKTYSVYDIVNEEDLPSLTATTDTQKYDVSFTGCLVIKLANGQ